jgi:hypothetical protein
MEQINTEALSENPEIGLLTAPSFTEAATEQAVPVKKLPAPTGTHTGLFGTRISLLWFLAIGIAATLTLGVIGGVLAGLIDNRDNRKQAAESSSLVDTGAGGSSIPQQPVAAAPVTVASEKQVERKDPAPGRDRTRVIHPRIPLSSLEPPEPDVSQDRPAARRVGVITGNSRFEYRRRKKADQSDN